MSDRAPEAATGVAGPGSPAGLDDTDRRILALLLADGRMSWTDIGKATRLSTSAAQQRVRRLEQRGVITGYTVRVDAAQLGRHLTALVSLEVKDNRLTQAGSDSLISHPEVVSCYSLAGTASHLVKVQVGSPAELEDVLNRFRADGMSTETMLVLSVPLQERILP